MLIKEKKYNFKKDALTDYFKGKLTAQELDTVSKDSFGVGVATKKELHGFLTNKFTQDVMSDTYGIPSKTLVKRARDLVKFAEGVSESVVNEGSVANKWNIQSQDIGKLQKKTSFSSETSMPFSLISNLSGGVNSTDKGIVSGHFNKDVVILQFYPKEDSRNDTMYDAVDKKGIIAIDKLMKKQYGLSMVSPFLLKGKRHCSADGEVCSVSNYLVFGATNESVMELKSEKDFKLGTPAVFDGDRGEVVTNPKTQRAWTPLGWSNVGKGVRGIMLYGSNSFIVPDWNKTKRFNESVIRELKVIDVVDQNNNLKLPKISYLNKTPFTGKAFIINGYNGYTSSKDDGYVVDSKTRNPLKDKSGNILKTTSHRGVTWKFTNGVKEKRYVRENEKTDTSAVSELSVNEDKKQISKLKNKSGNSEIKFYDILSKVEKKMGKKKYRQWLKDTLVDFKINGDHYDYRTNAAIEEKLFELS